MFYIISYLHNILFLFISNIFPNNVLNKLYYIEIYEYTKKIQCTRNNISNKL